MRANFNTWVQIVRQEAVQYAEAPLVGSCDWEAIRQGEVGIWCLGKLMQFYPFRMTVVFDIHCIGGSLDFVRFHVEDAGAFAGDLSTAVLLGPHVFGEISLESLLDAISESTV